VIGSQAARQSRWEDHRLRQLAAHGGESEHRGLRPAGSIDDRRRRQPRLRVGVERIHEPARRSGCEDEVVVEQQDQIDRATECLDPAVEVLAVARRPLVDDHARHTGEAVEVLRVIGRRPS
jgi:hypothetical protein